MAMSFCPASTFKPVRIQPAPSAPRTSGARILEPPADQVGELLSENRSIIDRSDYDVQGIRLGELAAQARAQLIAAALRYTRQYRDAPDPPASVDAAAARVLIAGHQPELFHPGVWLKNFALDQLANRHQAVAINLVIDSDTIKTTSVRVPTGSVEKPRVASVMFDKPSAEIPFQARSIQDFELFSSFGGRISERFGPLLPNPMVREFWPLAVEAARRTRNVGQSLSQARHQWEGRMGLTTLEIPQSVVCCLPAFRQLMAHLIAPLPRLWEVYNHALTEYRRQHHVRSHSHPAPELAAEGAWLEAPFWIWSGDNPLRRRAYVLPRGDDLVLSDLQGLELPLRLSAESEIATAIGQLATLCERGIRLGSRALLTTLAARVLLGDLFIHGIGGAKYDRLTDTMIQRFFCLTPPTFLVVSGTLHLPIPHPAPTSGDLQAVNRELRELEFHPETFLNSQGTSESAIERSQPATDGSAATHWIAEKRRWVDATVDRQNARQRCRAIREANQQLQPFVGERRAEFIRRGEVASAQLRADAVLASREYSFCLHPEQSLREFLLGFPYAV
jgi:hypothetical protein